MKRWTGFAIIASGFLLVAAASAAPHPQSPDSDRSVKARYARQAHGSAQKRHDRARSAINAGKLKSAHRSKTRSRLSVFKAGAPKRSIATSRGNWRLGERYVMHGKTYVPKYDPNYRVEGKASWYGSSFHGRRTANGERFDMDAVSAAHPTLPLPSYVRVTNLENRRSIIVRVNDRGPFRGGRLIDLSVRTAKLLGFYEQGLAPVRVEYLSPAKLGGINTAALEKTLTHNGAPATRLATK
jgi:rare lipoprotein A